MGGAEPEPAFREDEGEWEGDWWRWARLTMGGLMETGRRSLGVASNGGCCSARRAVKTWSG